ncbi:MAG: hypothetical protein ACYSYT_07130 [Planctomycetota bacterium]|jgi:hypothetical protein
MHISRYLKDAIVAQATVILILATALQAQNSAQPAPDELLRKLPAESLFCVRVNNLDYTFGTIDQFLAGASPIPMGASMIVRMQLAGLLGDPTLNNVKTTGSFAIFAVTAPDKPAQEDPAANTFIAGLLPVSDFQKFLSDNVKASLPDANGIAKITVTDLSGQSKTTLAAKAGNYALVASGNNYDKLVATAGAISLGTGLAATLDADQLKKAAGEPVWVYGNVQLASKTFGTVLLAQIENIKTMMESTQATGQGPIGNPAAIMKMYTGMLETLMKETRAVTLTLTPKPDACALTITVSAVPGTDMAKMLVADESSPKENKLLPYLKDGAVMNFGLNLNKILLGQINNKFVDILAAADETISPEDTAKIKTLSADMLGALGGSVAVSFSAQADTKPPFAATYAIELDDEQKFTNAMQQAVEMTNAGPIAKLNKTMGLATTCTMQRAVETYKGVSVDSARLVLKPTEPGSPQAQTLEAIYGDGIEYRWGIITAEKLCALAVGAHADSALRQLIDKVQANRTAPQQMPAEMTAAAKLIPQIATCDFGGTYNYIRLLKMAAAMAPMPKIDALSKSNIALAGRIDNAKFQTQIVLPKEHLAEITAAFQKMQQQMQQQLTTTPSADDDTPIDQP